MKHSILQALKFSAAALVLGAAPSLLAQATSATWNSNSNGNWSDGTKWQGGNPASGATAVATIDRSTFTLGRTITVDAPYEIGELRGIGSPGTERAIIISGANTLTLDNGVSNAVISNSGNGAMNISAAIALESSLDISNNANASTQFLSVGAISSATAGLKTVTVASSSQRVNIAGTISDGSGQVAVVIDAGSSGDVRVTAAQSFSGGLTIKSGEYRFFSGATSASLGSGAVTIDGGGIEFGAVAGFAATITNSLAVNAANSAVETVGTSAITWSGQITGAGGLDKLGAGTLLITNTNSYSGGTTVTDGILQTGAVGTLGTGDVSVLAGKTLTLGNNLSLDSSATFTFELTSIINLNYAGEMAIADLGTGLLFIDYGTYTAAELNSFFGGSTFAGTGFITVVPEPQSLQLIMVAAFLAFAVMGRRFRASLS